MATFLFDLDGTITARELLPEIAQAFGVAAEMRELTRLTVGGLIPFEASFRKRVDMLRSIPVAEVRKVVNAVPVHTRVAAFVRAHADECAIVTGNLDVWIEGLCAGLGARVHCSRARTQNGMVTGIDEVMDKRRVAEALLASCSRPLVVVGEGNNDTGMMELADIGIACGLVHEPARSVMSVASHAIYDEVALCRFLSSL